MDHLYICSNAPTFSRYSLLLFQLNCFLTPEKSKPSRDIRSFSMVNFSLDILEFTSVLHLKARLLPKPVRSYERQNIIQVYF